MKGKNILVEYEIVFPEGNDNIANLLIGIPKNIILKVGSTFLATELLDNDSLELHLWFSSTNVESYNDVTSRMIIPDELYHRFRANCTTPFLL